MFWERFYNLCLSIGSKPNPIGKQIGISSATITQWKQGTTPAGDNLIKIANYFKCSADYLLGIDDVPNRKEKNSVPELTGAEKRLLAAFKELTRDEQMAEVGRIEHMAEQASKAKNAETA